MYKRGNLTKAEIVITDTLSRAFENVSLDLLSCFEESVKGAKVIFTFQDELSKFLQCVPLPGMQAKSVSKAFFDENICQYGIPRIVLQNQATLVKHVAN